MLCVCVCRCCGVLGWSQYVFVCPVCFGVLSMGGSRTPDKFFLV